jgi:uncharacterized membrane protein
MNKIALLLCAITGFALVVLTPPFQVPDEGAHFFRAYQTSTLNLHLEKRNGRTGADLPHSLMDTFQLFYPLVANPSHKVSYSLYANALSMKPDSSPGFCSVILAYPPVPYIAQAIGIAAGRAMSTPPIVFFYFARILNLALFLFLIFCAMRWMPDMKWGLALLALMPMTLYEAASLSADAYTIGISFLFIAFLLHCAAESQILSRGKIAFMLLGTALVALAKPSYSPIFLLALIIPERAFGTRKRKLWTLGGMLAVALALGVLSVDMMRGLTMGLPGSDSAAQFKFILDHPLHFIATLFRSVFRAYLFGSVIGRLGWMEQPLPLWIVIPYGLLLVAASFDGRRTLILSKHQRWFITGLFALLVAILFTGQYLAYTPVGQKAINGLQGRYFIPIAPLLLLLFQSGRKSFSLDEHAIARRLIIGFVILAHVTSAVLITRWYYL